MAHVLDRPIWAALTTHHEPFAYGQGRARRYDAAFAPFVGTEGDTGQNMADLAKVIPAGGAVALFTLDELDFPPALACSRRATLEQMICDQPPFSTAVAPPGLKLRALTSDDLGAATALVDRTKPGPFAQRTLELGRYLGLFSGQALVAMAGERMSVPGHVEVSAVCTDPAHRGQGLAKLLIAGLCQDAFARGLTPFLHAFTDNLSALAVYRQLGFAARRRFHLAVVGHAPATVPAHSDPA